jgi:hypothetical protein
MRLKQAVPVFLFLAAAAFGQTTDIHGIKIKESSFDAQARTLSLTFINDRAADIIAYHYCFTVLSTDSNQTRQQCEVIDALTTDLEMKAARKARPGLPEITFLAPSENVVHPGEERRIEERIPWSGIFIGGSIAIDAVAWSDDTFEGAAEPIIEERTAELQERQFVSRTVRDSLSGAGPMMIASAIAALQHEFQEAEKDRCFACQTKRMRVVMNAILHLKQPERHMGKEKEYVPDDQSKFLEQFLARHDSLTAEHAKHISLRKMTHEEEIVRTAYAKLSFAAQIGMLWHAISGHQTWPGLDDGLGLSKAMNEQIRFDLAGFRVGNISEIRDKPWSWLVEGPVNALSVPYTEIPVGIKKKDGVQEIYPIVYADAAWQQEAPRPVEINEERKPGSKVPTIDEVLRSQKENLRNWERYASYSVVAMLRGRSISYRAAFLFSESGSEVLALDYATGMNISRFISTPMYPSALVDTAYRELPFIQAWIVSNEITGCKQFTVPEVCCDAKSGRCGLASEDLQNSLSVFIDPDDRFILNFVKSTPKKGGK